MINPTPYNPLQGNPAMKMAPPMQMQQYPQTIQINTEDLQEEGPDFEITDAQKAAEKVMSDEQRKRFNLLNSADCTKIPKTRIKELMKANAPEGTVVSEETAKIASVAIKLFVIELIETSKKFHTGKGPLLPEDILLGFRKLEEEGKIPGKSSGKIRGYVK